MKINPSGTARRFLESLQNESKDTFDMLNVLVEELENKNDPDQVEIKLLDQLYHFLEHFKTLENNIRTYTKMNNKNLLGNKLSSLNEERSFDGNCKYID